MPSDSLWLRAKVRSGVSLTDRATICFVVASNQILLSLSFTIKCTKPLVFRSLQYLSYLLPFEDQLAPKQVVELPVVVPKVGAGAEAGGARAVTGEDDNAPRPAPRRGKVNFSAMSPCEAIASRLEAIANRNKETSKRKKGL